MAINYNPRVVTDGLLVSLDAANTKSYPRSGTTWIDLSGNNNNAIIESTSMYSSQFGGSFFFDNTVNARITLTGVNWNTLGSTQNLTFMFGALKTQYGTGGNNAGDSNLFFGATNGYNNGWRISENNGGTPGDPFSGVQSYHMGMPFINPSSYIQVNDTVANRLAICAFSRSNASATAFLNGSISTVNTFQSYVSGGNYGYVGASPNQFGGGRFGGYLTFIYVYNRGLSLSEIQQNFNALRGRYGI